MTDDPSKPAVSIPTDSERRYLAEATTTCREVLGGRELTDAEAAMLLRVHRSRGDTTATERNQQ